MCKVNVKKSMQGVEFIIYNHLFSKSTYSFTVNQLIHDLEQYDLELSLEDVQHEINSLVKAGLVKHNLRCYSICGR